MNIERSTELEISKALADAETARRRATMALKFAKEALKLSLGSPRIGLLIKEIDDELKED